MFSKSEEEKMKFTDAANTETRCTTPGSASADLRAVGGAVAGSVDAGGRVANVVLKPDDCE
jgi:hypothetical protein